MGSKWTHRLSDVNVNERTATCAACGPTEIKVQTGRSPICMTKVREWRTKYPQRRSAPTPESRHRKRLTSHHLTVEQYDTLLAAQNGVCAICEKRPPTHIDHDHACCPQNNGSCGQCVRGLLCGNCNTALGKFGDDSATLSRAINYLG